MADPVALEPRQVAALLRATPTILRAELEALPDGLAGWHPASGSWCVNETIGHLIRSDRGGFGGRIRSMLAPGDTRFSPWRPGDGEQGEPDCRRELTDSLREFGEVRDESVAFVVGLSESDLQRAMDHPKVGSIRVAEVLHDWVYHDREHVRQILGNVQAAVLPCMGNLRRFFDGERR